MNAKLPLQLSCAALFAASASILSAANVVVTDTTLTTGATAMGTTNLDATNSTAKATLLGLDGYSSIRTYSGFGTNNISTGTAFIFAFTDTSSADVQITITGNIPSNQAYVNNSAFQTSSGGSFRVAGNAGIEGSDADEVTYRLDLGSYNSALDTFTTGGGVEALGFTLTGVYDRTDVTGGATIVYYDTIGSVLSTQVLTAASSKFGYTGFQSTGAAISYLEITFQGDAGEAPIWGLDDLGMTSSIPEPSTYALLTAGLAGLMVVARRKISK